MREICTIGFSRKSLERFVALLKNANVTRLVDVRLHNTSQMAGFSKKEDLEYIMKLVGIQYTHDTSLAPDEELFDDFKERYIKTLQDREVDQRVKAILGDGIPCFLCSEEKPQQCHRGLLADYLREHSREEVRVRHLV